MEPNEPRAIVVTGAAQGIGRAIAEAAAARGWRVGVLDRDAQGARSVAERLPGACALVASTTDEAEVDAALEAFGPIDALVNNAGIVRFGPLLDIDAADFRAVLDVNVVGTFLVSRAAARRMSERSRGAIVNITSVNGIAPGPNGGAYGTSKSAIALLTEQMALEWGPLGIRVNAVAPGLIDAGMSNAIHADPELRALREARVPLRRLGTAADVAEVVLFLVSDEASYVTGHELVVDGGVIRSILAHLPRPRSVDGVGYRSGANADRT